jgi:hypothetical protein
MPATAFFSLSSNSHEKEHNSLAIECKLRLHIQEAHPESEKLLKIRGGECEKSNHKCMELNLCFCRLTY